MCFDIEAELWAQPLPLRLFLRTELDLETGEVAVAEVAGGDRELMDQRLLDYYNRELQYLRELGGEFARQFPKIAGRLGLDAFECADPYVERLLEGFAFLGGARAAQDRRRVPALHRAHAGDGVSALSRADAVDGRRADAAQSPAGRAHRRLHRAARHRAARQHRQGGADGVRIPHRARPRAVAARDRGHRPLRRMWATSATSTWRTKRPIKAALRIKLRTVDGLKFAQLSLEELPLFMRGQDQVALRLYELLLAGTVGGRSCARPTSRGTEVVDRLPVRAVGFDDDEALLPYGPRSFQGYRLLARVFRAARAVSSSSRSAGSGRPCGAARARARDHRAARSPRRQRRRRGRPVAPRALLHARRSICFRAAPIAFTFASGCNEYHVVPDRTRPMDLEVHTVTEVVGYGTSADIRREFLPFYACNERTTSSTRRRLLHGPSASLASPPRASAATDRARAYARQRGVHRAGRRQAKGPTAPISASSR